MKKKMRVLQIAATLAVIGLFALRWMKVIPTPLFAVLEAATLAVFFVIQHSWRNKGKNDSV